MANSVYLNGSLEKVPQIVGTLSSSLHKLSGTLGTSESLKGCLSNGVLRGMSAYDIAVAIGGFDGTEEEWLASLAADNIEIRNNDGVIEYKYESESLWTILIDLSDYTNDYEMLINRPELDGVTLSGNRNLYDTYLENENSLTNEEIEELLSNN